MHQTKRPGSHHVASPPFYLHPRGEVDPQPLTLTDLSSRAHSLILLEAKLFPSRMLEYGTLIPIDWTPE